MRHTKRREVAGKFVKSLVEAFLEFPEVVRKLEELVARLAGQQVQASASGQRIHTMGSFQEQVVAGSRRALNPNVQGVVNGKKVPAPVASQAVAQATATPSVSKRRGRQPKPGTFHHADSVPDLGARRQLTDAEKTEIREALKGTHQKTRRKLRVALAKQLGVSLAQVAAVTAHMSGKFAARRKRAEARRAKAQKGKTSATAKAAKLPKSQPGAKKRRGPRRANHRH